MVPTPPTPSTPLATPQSSTTRRQSSTSLAAPSAASPSPTSTRTVGPRSGCPTTARATLSFSSSVPPRPSSSSEPLSYPLPSLSLKSVSLIRRKQLIQIQLIYLHISKN